jgi:hypothetical protein
MLAPAVAPVCHARGVTYLIRTERRGCSMASGRNSTKRAGVISKGWARKFDDPFPLPNGCKLAPRWGRFARFAKPSRAAFALWFSNSPTQQKVASIARGRSSPKPGEQI